MPSKCIVLDANILIRAVLGQRVGQLIADYSGAVGFYVAEPNYAEAVHYLEHLTQTRGIARDLWTAALEACMAGIQIIPTAECDLVREQALARIGDRDPQDWPAVAVALQLECPIWTEDADFFGCGLPVWTTRTVELYFLET